MKQLAAAAWRRFGRLRARATLGKIDFGQLRRLKPVSKRWGFDRGQPIDRFYIEQFLDRERESIRGAVLEIGDDRYVRMFGDSRCDSIDVLHYVEGNPGTTIVGDLCDAPQIADGSFDCVVCTQTLQFVENPARAFATLCRILRPGGVLLMTVPALSPLDNDRRHAWHDRFRFTSVGVKQLVRDAVGESADADINVVGNVLVATAFLQGLAAEELTAEELAARDPRYELLVTLRLRRSAAG